MEFGSQTEILLSIKKSQSLKKQLGLPFISHTDILPSRSNTQSSCSWELNDVTILLFDWEVEESLFETQILLLSQQAKPSPDTFSGEISCLSEGVGGGLIPLLILLNQEKTRNSHPRRRRKLRNSNSKNVFLFIFFSSAIFCWFCNLLAAGKNIVFKGLL